VAGRCDEEPDWLLLGSSLRRAFREATVAVSRALIHHHLSQLEYHLLLELAASGGLGQSRLGERLQAPRARLSILVRGLEHRGLVKSFRPQEDRRQVRVGLTPAGMERLTAAQRAVRQAVVEMVGQLPREQLVELLEGALQRYLDLDVTIVLNDRRSHAGKRRLQARA
jgi:DNA-binding MarR family transcriptional regulator